MPSGPLGATVDHVHQETLNYKAVLAYDGTEFAGYQMQGGLKNVVTIQHRLERAFETVTRQPRKVCPAAATVPPPPSHPPPSHPPLRTPCPRALPRAGRYDHTFTVTSAGAASGSPHLAGAC